MSASKNGKKTRGRPFEPGNPGGPGRREGSRDKATVLLDKLAEAGGEEILHKTLEDAKGEIPMRASWCWIAFGRSGRAFPCRSVGLRSSQPPMSWAALGLVAEAVGAGELTPEEGASVAAVLEIKRKAIETAELDARITVLEEEKK